MRRLRSRRSLRPWRLSQTLFAIEAFAPEAVFQTEQAGGRQDPSAGDGASQREWNSHEHAGNQTLDRGGRLGIEAVLSLQIECADAAGEKAEHRCERQGEPE